MVKHEASGLPSPDIYVHVPKTAGITMRDLVMERYGTDRTYGFDVVSGRLSSMKKQGVKPGKTGETTSAKAIRAAGRIPPAIPRAGIWVRDKLIGEEPEVALRKAGAVMGHFPADTFDKLVDPEATRYFTVMRDPLERMYSHYRYLQMLKPLLPGLRHFGNRDPHHLPFEDFALHEDMQNYQSQYVGPSLGRYALVGTTEHLDDFLRGVGLLPPGRMAPHLNQTTGGEAAHPIMNDPGFVRDFQNFHSQDYDLYRQAVERSPKKPI